MKKKSLESRLSLKRNVISKLNSNHLMGGCPTGSLCWFTDGCTQNTCADDCYISEEPTECLPKK